MEYTDSNSPEKVRYFMEIAYDGTDFCGWQVQPDKVSVQSTIDEAISTIFNETLHCTGCGRTDSGVHASKFFLHFDSTQTVPPENFLNRINKFLPKSIAVFDVFESDKHARFDATYRAYDYFLHFKKTPFKNQFSFFFPFRPVDVEKMKTAFALLSNYTDFSPFEKSNSSSKTSICQIYKTDIIFDEQAHSMRIHIAANRFLRGMVRRVVGSLLMVGVGKISLEEFKTVMDNQGTFSYNISVTGRGLFLSEVRYDNYCLLGGYQLETMENERIEY